MTQIDICRSEVLEKTHELLSLYALLTLKEKGRIGRKRLALDLGTGEATARTVLEKLKSISLLQETRLGASLTARGREFVERMAGLLDKLEVSEVRGVTGYLVGFVVKKRARLVKSGVEERDEAVRGGARGALVLSYTGGKLVFPNNLGVCDFVVLNPEAEEKLSDGDCVIIAWADTKLKAVLGSLRASLNLACRPLSE